VQVHELIQLEKQIEELVETRNAEGLVELVNKYVRSPLVVKEYNYLLRAQTMKLFTEKYIVLMFATKTSTEIHVFKMWSETPNGWRRSGVKVLKAVLPRK